MLRFGATTDVGRYRDQNEDRWGADSGAGLFIVSDGIGGVPHGEFAAQCAVDKLADYVTLQRDSEQVDADDHLPAAIALLSDDLVAQSQTAGGVKGTGATIVAALITGSTCVVSHLGDSPAYLLSGGVLERLTVDHTIAQILVDAGQLKVEDVHTHPGRNKLTRFLGMNPPARPDVKRFDLKPGDRLLLCSDGVSGVLDDNTLKHIVADNEDVRIACETLVRAADQAGSHDNMTAVVIEASA